MLGRLMFLLVAIGCSSPSVAKKREVWVPADDEEASAAWHRAHPRPPPPYRFEWELVRQRWERRPTGLPCDACRRAPPTWGWCCLPGKTPQRAAKVTVWWPVGARTRLRLDVGAEARITKDWYAALVDERGRPITEWVQLDQVGPGSAQVTVSIGHDKIERASTRVALVEELPE